MWLGNILGGDLSFRQIMTKARDYALRSNTEGKEKAIWRSDTGLKTAMAVGTVAVCPGL